MLLISLYLAMLRCQLKTHKYSHTHIHAHTWKHTYMQTPSTNVHMQKCTKYMHIPRQMHTLTHRRTHVHIHMCAHTHRHLHVLCQRNFICCCWMFCFRNYFFKKPLCSTNSTLSTTSLSTYSSILGLGLEYLSLFHIISEVLYFQSSIGETY